MKLQPLLVVAALCMQLVGALDWDPANIIKLQASDAQHTFYERSGNDIVCALMSTDLGAGKQQRDTRDPPSARSEFYGHRKDGFNWQVKTKQWYWFSVDPHTSACDFNYWGWSPVFHYLDSNFNTGQGWQCKRWLHYDEKSTVPVKDQKYKIGRGGRGKDAYVATGAEYNHAIHPYNSDGWVLFQQSFSTRAAARLKWGRGNQDAVLDTELPNLRQESDFLYNTWQAAHHKGGQDDAKRVKWCGVANADDLVTYNLLARYLVARGLSDLEPWPAPRSQYLTNTPEGRALLGSPAARNCMLFLLQHKDTLGIKYITNIRVFRGPDLARPKLLKTVHFPQFVFEVQDVPPNLVKADPAPDWVPPPAPGPPPPPVSLQPANPQPGISGPANSQPDPPPNAQVIPRQTVPDVNHKVSHEGSDKNFVRVHTFRIA